MAEDLKHNEKWEEAVGLRMTEDKKLVINALREQPNISLACRKAGVATSTYYRWIKDDPFFKYRADNARNEGKCNRNDMVESALVMAAKKGEPWAVKYYLDHQSPEYQLKSIFEKNKEIEFGSDAISIMTQGEVWSYKKYLANSEEFRKMAVSDNRALARAIEIYLKNIGDISSPLVLGEDDIIKETPDGSEPQKQEG